MGAVDNRFVLLQECDSFQVVMTWCITNIRKKCRSVVVHNRSITELDVALSRKVLHISAFTPNLTAENHLYYVTKHGEVTYNSIFCFRLEEN